MAYSASVETLISSEIMPTPPDIETQWPNRLRELLAASPIVQDVVIATEPAGEPGGFRADGEVHFRIADESHRLVIECKSSGQPRHVRDAMSQLGREITRSHELTRGLVVAPFLSLASRALLAESGMGWLDLAGNARIVFPRFFLEISMANRDPFATKRAHRSLFSPKSARLLQLLLLRPQAWKVVDLATEAGVSVGQVSNVRKALIDREWAQTEAGEGFHLTKPNALLDAWRDDGVQAPTLLKRAYTLQHGAGLDSAIDQAFAVAAASGAKLRLASHSVARRVAPFARVSGEFFYADAAGLQLLENHLQLVPTDKGENATIYRAKDDGLWMEPINLQSEIKGTGLIQTYLDLLASGERGREAAEHWRAEKITPILTEAP